MAVAGIAKITAAMMAVVMATMAAVVMAAMMIVMMTAMMIVMMTATVAVMVMHHVLMVQQGIIGGRVEKLLVGISSTAVIFIWLTFRIP